MFPERCSKIALVTGVLVAVYVGGYLYVRSQHWLVHRSGFAYGKTDSHSVVMGDLGPGMAAGYPMAHLSYYLFTPLRWGETACWYACYPAGRPWPY